MTREEGKLKIEQLVDDFSRNEAQYLNKTFQEAETRNRFIDPLFGALGWSLDETGPRQFWDVHREFSQRDNSRTKKPDYAFRIDGKLRFFVEAKAPHVSLMDKSPVFQAKRYAYSTNGKAPIVILTDFEEFRVFNALQKPEEANPEQGLLKQFDLHYHKYLDKWDHLYDHFSKEAVREGSLDALAKKIGKNTRAMDEEFLLQLTDWREQLARHMAVRNTNLSVDDLNEAVQRILDRLVFIRCLEDRGIEPEDLLLNAAKSNSPFEGVVYQQLIPIFHRLNAEYNGLIFKEHFSERQTIDDKVLKKIIIEMCWPKSPFQFDVIEPEILGQIYERFLGSKIRLTDGHRAKVEEKPEVRKAGGVYYTPRYIVDYIVKNTVGRLLNSPLEKGAGGLFFNNAVPDANEQPPESPFVKGDLAMMTPDQIKNIKILDPACGSGSFLLGAFDYLVAYHEHWYGQNPGVKAYQKDYVRLPNGDIQLTMRKKGEILKNNLFGVDIDREATEVTIMSLYLKALEQGLEQQKELFPRGSILPDMTRNIKCGNSLIGSDFYSGQGQLDFGADMATMKRINAFDWEQEFAEIFAPAPTKPVGSAETRRVSSPGFDCVIGNPPYIRIQAMKEWAPTEVEFYKKLYKSASKGNYDIYVVFVEKGLSLLNEKGLLGFILPHKFFNAQYGEPLRELIAKGKNLNKIIHFGHQQIFSGATTYTCLLFLSKLENTDFYFGNVDNLISWQTNQDFGFNKIDINTLFSQKEWNITTNDSNSLLSRLKSLPIKLGEISSIFVGTQTSADTVFVLQDAKMDEAYVVGYSKSLDKFVKVEKEITKPFLKGKQIRRYQPLESTGKLICPYEINDVTGSEN